MINKLNESTKKEESLSLEISQLKEMLDKKNSELIKSSLLNANNIININNNHNNINNSVMMNNNMISDNEIINLLNQKISRISCDNKTLETKIKMYKDEKKLSQDMVQKLQYEVITLKKKMEMKCNEGFVEEQETGRGTDAGSLHEKCARPISSEIRRAHMHYAAFRICMNSSPVIVSCS